MILGESNKCQEQIESRCNPGTQKILFSLPIQRQCHILLKNFNPDQAGASETVTPVNLEGEVGESQVQGWFGLQNKFKTWRINLRLT